MVAVNAEKNKELLADVPYQLKEDLALIYKVKLETNNEEMATVTIHNNLLKTWGATKEEIHELAMKNTRELLPVTIQSIDEVMRELFARDGMPKEIAEAMFTEMPADQQMYVISNKPKVNGAASIFYEDELAKLAEKLGTDAKAQDQELKKQYALIKNYMEKGSFKVNEDVLSFYQAVGHGEASRNAREYGIFASDVRYITAKNVDEIVVRVLTTPDLVNGKTTITTTVTVLDKNNKVLKEICSKDLDAKAFNKAIFEIAEEYKLKDCKTQKKNHRRNL